MQIKNYIDCLAQPGQPPFPFSLATGHSDQVDQVTEMEETMMVGLRLTQEGVSRRSFKQRFGMPVEKVFSKEIDQMVQAGLLEAGEILRLTPRGRLLGNQVFMQFVSTRP